MNDEFAADPPAAGNLTQLLRSARSGGGSALDQLFGMLYRELHALAHQQLARNSAQGRLNTTMLVHEAYLRFAGAGDALAEDRQHFLAYASSVMRSVVIDVIRAERARKRGGGEQALTLNTDIVDFESSTNEEALRIHEALLELGAIDPRLVQIVEMRFFAGLTDADIAGALDLSPRTVQRYWQKARLFLYAQLNEVSGGAQSP